ncbi:MAG: PorV/PorQ family protein [Bacteroidota bacterium]|nr:PorV/PorQ family protein [Bacteroidota bacterium]MDE2957974.1 PorV/PorQ family protein [Bacteroidota bacterium]
MKRVALYLVWSAVAVCPSAHGQRIAKYGADFLAGGVGARALAMGGAQVALVKNVNSVYWNPAGMARTAYPEVAYMHAERFAGVVSFDYAAVTLPVSDESTIGLSYFRSGVNDIKNTLNAWDAERNQPKANPELYVSSFSAADMAYFVSYARRLRSRLSVGISGKLIRRMIGDFADAWGYSFDAGIQWQGRRVVLGVQVQDVSTMLQSWSVNPSAFAIEGTNPETGTAYTFQEVFAQELPSGQTFLVLPVLRLGSGIVLPVGQVSSVTVGLDMDVAFDGQQANAFNAGAVSVHPRAGVEYSFQQVLAVRAGINRLASGTAGLDIVPSVGAGFRLGSFALDYGFGDFGGLVSELGYSHRISVHVSLNRQRWERSGDAL